MIESEEDKENMQDVDILHRWLDKNVMEFDEENFSNFAMGKLTKQQLQLTGDQQEKKLAAKKKKKT